MIELMVVKKWSVPVQCSVDAYYTKVYVEEAYFAIYLVAINN